MHTASINSVPAPSDLNTAVPIPTVVDPGLRVPELLAPAGDWDCARAAIENGADAIYFGLEKFNARMRAHNFTQADLPKLMQFLHVRGVKAYVTFNTLVFENELAEAEQYLRTIIAAGVDAAIVQDVGICRLIRQLSPDFPIHVSTQMTITSAGGVEFVRELGCNLVVLARECSLKEIEKIQSAGEMPSSDCRAADSDVSSSAPNTRHSSLPLEVFVHGALCVAYSGQCLTSEALGGRSANRGECAQACRLPYDLIADGKQVNLGDRKYLLSPQDLAGLDVLPELARLGLASLKIEGRLKTPEYVANITRVYRMALDEMKASKLKRGSEKPSCSTPGTQYEMEMAFSRGLYTGWLGGINNQALVHARFGKKRGVYLGHVVNVKQEGVLVGLEGPLKAGDGVVFDAGHPEEKEQGGRVYKVQSRKSGGGSAGSPCFLSFGRGDVDLTRIHIGDRVWKTSDPELDRRLRRSFQGDSPRFRRPISVEAHGSAGHVLTLIARDEAAHLVCVESAMLLVKADQQPVTTARLRAQLGRLGGTPFELAELRNRISGNVLLPVSEINRLRRTIVDQLIIERAKPPRWTLRAGEGTFLSSAAPASLTGVGAATGYGATRYSRVNEDKNSRAPSEKTSEQGTPGLNVLVRNLLQLQAALPSGARTLYCEFEDPKKYPEAVALVRSSGTESNRPLVFIAPPRIFKMGEEWILKQVRSANADGYLARNYDHLRFFADDRRVGDYSLNIANHLTADYFMNKFGLERVTASYDLNFAQLETLLQATPPEWIEVTIHQHIPMFHMEHCVFCAFLSKGTDYTNCGRPCDRHDLKLRDRVGAEHPVKADVGCRNTVFHARAQTGAEHFASLMHLGVRHFRLEFLNESPDTVAETISRYQLLLAGKISGQRLWNELKLFNQLGVMP